MPTRESPIGDRWRGRLRIRPPARRDLDLVAVYEGLGGCEDLLCYIALLHATRGQGYIALACAWSGIAAVLLQGGRTCHSRFGLPVPMPRGPVYRWPSPVLR